MSCLTALCLPITTKENKSDCIKNHIYALSLKYPFPLLPIFTNHRQFHKILRHDYRRMLYQMPLTPNLMSMNCYNSLFHNGCCHYLFLSLVVKPFVRETVPGQ